MRELVFETEFDDTDEISDCLIALGGLSVTVEDAHAEGPAERPIFGEPGTALDIQAWPTSKIMVLLDPDTDPRSFWREFCATDSRFESLAVEVRDIADQDWVRETQRQFTPFVVEDQLWVGPHWTEPPASFQNSGIVIRLDPGMAFGTGSHATTQLCLESLIQIGRQRSIVHDCVLDMGCGSGILAIAAAKLGATEVLAVDIDPIAVDTAQQNALANRAVITAHDAEHAIDGQFDVVIANILAQPLKVLAPALTRFARPHGALLLSGILARQADEILQVYRPLSAHLGQLSVLRERDGWVCIGTLGN
jgi:ribosomal protein L11 methyltransferase